MNLALRQEKALFNVNIALAILFWLVLIVGTFGFGLLYIVGAFVFYLFVHSALIAVLRGNSVLITPEQFPDLHTRIQQACEKLKMPAPAAYIMNGNGVLNAFATKFMSRYYIVLFSNVVDAFEPEDSAIDFYIGHELGHIHRKHLLWWPIFLPLTLLPLLMPAYRRACESTCDQYGTFCSTSKEDAVRGLSLLATGGKRWKTLSISQFMEQIKESGGFWMSFHELTGSYPWLSKRVALVVGGEAAKATFPKRHILARIMGVFCPGFLPGAFMPLLVVYMTFIIAMAAIPAWQKFKGKATAGTLASNTNTTWTNPVNGKLITLPTGFKTVANIGKSNLLVGTFTNNPDLILEQLLLEQSSQKIDFNTYVNALHKSKKDLMGTQVEISSPQTISGSGFEASQFSFFSQTEGIKFENTIRVWTYDSLHFWHIISTVKADSLSARSDSERFVDFLATAVQ